MPSTTNYYLPTIPRYTRPAVASLGELLFIHNPMNAAMTLRSCLLRSFFCTLTALCGLLTPLFGQHDASRFAFSPTIVLPQQKAYTSDSTTIGPRITGIDAVITIDNTTATTELTVEVAHPFSKESNIAAESWERLTATIPFSLAVPIPTGAVIQSTRSSKGDEGNFSQREITGTEAVTEYQNIARHVSNPNLLEFVGTTLLRWGNFSVAAGESTSFTVVYKESLKTNGNRVDYILPRSESFAFRPTPWNITVKIASQKSIAGIHSSSHLIAIDQSSSTQAVVNVQAFSINGNGGQRVAGRITGTEAESRSGRKNLDPGSFRLSWITGNELSASFFAYPSEQSEGGSFMLLAGAPPLAESDNNAIRREVILVIDRSGSMRGDKIAQVQSAAQRVLEELNDGEAFNIVDYADSVRQYAPKPVIKNAETLRQAEEYIGAILADKGTNIHDALVTALSQKPTPGCLPIVIFLTDGTPTVGVVQEALIREGVAKANTYNRRIFTFGVGYDVNAPLLEAIATESKGTTTFALPFDDIELKIAGLFRQLNGPVFSDITLTITTEEGNDAAHLVKDVLPEKIADLFEGDRLILVGNYLQDSPLVFTLRGNYLGAERTFSFTLDPERDRDLDAPWVYRLWAQRKITDNVVRVTQAGAIPEKDRTAQAETELQELTGEIVRLCTDNGIITEYTDFLVNPSAEAQDVVELENMTKDKLKFRAQDCRTGKGAINQSMNNGFAAQSNGDNRANIRLDENLQVVEITSVQQIHDLAFFRRNDRWVDARLLDSAETIEPDQTIRFGTSEYDRFIRDLIDTRRQRVLALDGDILLRHEGRIVLITGTVTLE